MESEAIVNMVTAGYEDDKGFIVGTVCMDDNSTTKSQLRHKWADKIREGIMNEEEWPRTAKGKKKPDMGKLETYMTALAYVQIRHTAKRSLEMPSML